MSKHECSVCGWVYDEKEGFPEAGITAGTKFEDLADDWFCPFCSADKEKFNQLRGT
ncbi:MAG: rubredoxin [Proteobacteria bacterium]|nr:rubredoxin [Pseudomonadota bacterium]